MVEGSTRASLPVSSPTPGHLSSPSSLPLWSRSQDKWLTRQTLRMLRPGEIGGPGKVTQLTLEGSGLEPSSFPQPQTAGEAGQGIHGAFPERGSGQGCLGRAGPGHTV